MDIFLAESAGFCSGVKNAVSTVLKEACKGNIACLGPVVHNRHIITELESKGVATINDPKEACGRRVVIRAHGVTKSEITEMETLGISCIDCTCENVKKIRELVSKKAHYGYDIIITGDPGHPEVRGIASFADKPPIYMNSVEDALSFLPADGAKYAALSQTTFDTELFDKITDILEKKCFHSVEIFNTICGATEKRQREAGFIAKRMDRMIVLGDKSSANAGRLYDICRRYCKNSYFVETIGELELNIFQTNDKIGITAGASTPSVIIKEAVSKMSERDNDNVNVVNDQTFEEMLNESFVTLRTGDIVKGTVIRVVGGEVSVNLGYKSDGLITKTEFSDDPDINPADVLKAGDEIEVFVVRVNDGDGNVLLSKKRLEIQKGFEEIERAFAEKTTVSGKVTEVVKGGLICMVKGVRVFVPSSQVAARYVDDLNKFVGNDYDFLILEYDKGKRRIVAGRRDLAIQEDNAKKAELFAKIEEGQRLSGTVSRLVDFGAFVDIGGADGLVHISEISWGRVRKASDVLKEGDSVTVTVLKVDREKEKISLSLKDITENPWNNANANYPVGSIAEGRIVRMVSFGAFVELEPGVDGLIHISQIAQKHVVRPEDELKIGEIVNVKIVDVDTENKKISLSKKEADGILNPQEDDGEEYSQSGDTAYPEEAETESVCASEPAEAAEEAEACEAADAAEEENAPEDGSEE